MPRLVVVLLLVLASLVLSTGAAWAETRIEETMDDRYVVVPDGWTLVEDMDGWLVGPEPRLGYSYQAYVLIVDDFYNLNMDDVKGQIGAVFGYLTPQYEIEDRQPADSEAAESPDDVAVTTISGWHVGTAESPRTLCLAMLIQMPSGAQRVYYLEARDDAEAGDLMTLIGMLNASIDMSDTDRSNLVKMNFAFSTAAAMEDD